MDERTAAISSSLYVGHATPSGTILRLCPEDDCKIPWCDPSEDTASVVTVIAESYLRTSKRYLSTSSSPPRLLCLRTVDTEVFCRRGHQIRDVAVVNYLINRLCLGCCISCNSMSETLRINEKVWRKAFYYIKLYNWFNTHTHTQIHVYNIKVYIIWIDEQTKLVNK